MRTLAALLGLVLALGLAACGGDDGEEASPPPSPPPAETTETGTGSEADGAAVFASAGCGSCHTLAAAGSSGSVGPSLDGANLSVEAVADQVRNGGGAMPAFDDRLSDGEIQAVAVFVSEASAN